MNSRLLRLAPGALLAVLALATASLLAYGFTRPSPAPLAVIGAYATDLSGRTPNQRFNADRAAQAVDGSVIAPGAQFSFNLSVGGWTRGRGYVRAPVSYGGELIDGYGGGVCQTSTTIYNAALVSGLTILERHQHTFAPSYAPVGRDAAVAFPGVDLRLRNPYAYPVTIRIAEKNGMLVCRMMARTKSLPSVKIVSRTTQIIPAAPVYAGSGSHRPMSQWRLEGRDGYHVLVYRQSLSRPSGPRELISDNTYEPLSAVWPSR